MEMTGRDKDVLSIIENLTIVYEGVWFRPMDLGGSDASHHSATLRKLVKLGLVERKRRAGLHRPSYLYRAVVKK